MREILFRGKRVDDGNWVYGYYLYIKEQDKHYILTGKLKTYPVDAVHPYLVTEGFEWIEIDHKTLGQYTGLYDKNGVEIYDGDIIKSNMMSNIRAIVFDDYDSSFSLYDINSNISVRLFKSLCGEYEVIGNVFDDKESLEVDK